MTGEGVAAIITSVFAGMVALFSAWRGYQKDKKLRGRPTRADDSEINAALHAVELYKSIVLDYEERDAQRKLELVEERDQRHAIERTADDLRRRLAMYESIDVDDAEKNRRRPSRG